jgi:hypothetical protein
MPFKLDTVLTLAKSFTTKITKEGGQEITVCEIKFSGMPIQRDVVDPMLGMPFGWAALALYDEQGAPLNRLTISSYRSALRVTGRIVGPRNEPVLALIQAALSDIEVGLMDKGGIVAGKLSWKARGDEVEDADQLLGKVCLAEFEITDGDQADMFERNKRLMETSGAIASSMLDRMAEIRRNTGNNGAQPGSDS